MSHARAFKTPQGYVDPYVVRLFNVRTGEYDIFHSWHDSRGSAEDEVRDLNSRHYDHEVYD